MAYPPEHRRATRQRIVDAAGRLFRRDGYAGARIDDIMAEADLTRGGFYLHFDSKQSLFEAVLREELEFTTQLSKARASTPDDPRAGALAAIDYYLTPRNRAKIAQGCTIVSNAADMARSKPAARRAFTRVFAELVAEFEEVARGSDAPRERALAAIATCVGGVVLARALSGEEPVAELLEACRENVVETLDAE